MAAALSEFEITPELVLRAYAAGLFPMADSAESEELRWIDPHRRGVFPLDGLIVSRSLAKTVRSERFEVMADGDFDAVIEGCAQRLDGSPTWISPQIRQLYRALFDMGFVHTIEARQDGALVGGLYGVALGGAFFGESMFHRARDASKVALVHLVARLRLGGYRLLDAQFLTDHLKSLGAVEIPRRTYRARLEDALPVAPDAAVWTRALSGREALARLGADTQ
jgi:leucyl/phenylalanyl-tRNA--protein transferase